MLKKGVALWNAAMTVKAIGTIDRIAGKRKGLLGKTNETASRMNVKTTVVVMMMTMTHRL